MITIPVSNPDKEPVTMKATSMPKIIAHPDRYTEYEGIVEYRQAILIYNGRQYAYEVIQVSWDECVIYGYNGGNCVTKLKFLEFAFDKDL